MSAFTVALGVLAAALHAVAYVLYFLKTHHGQVWPNAVTWGCWTFLVTLLMLTFRKVSDDPVAPFQLYMASVACLAMFVYAMASRRFSVSRDDWLLLALGIAVAIVYWVFQRADFANLLVLSAFVISIVPTFRGTLRDPSKEDAGPWTIWATAYAITTVNVVLRWHGKSLALLTPIVLLLCHGSIAVLSRKTRKEHHFLSP